MAILVVACGGSSTSSGLPAATPPAAQSGAATPRRVDIKLPPSGILVLADAGSLFAFYVPESSVPANASDLPQYTLDVCTAVSPTISEIISGLGITKFSLPVGVPASGFATSCTADALKLTKTIVVTEPGTPLPSDVPLVELIFQ